MIDLFEVGARVQQVCDSIGLPCCFIGGVAVQRWGEPRVTRDVDRIVKRNSTLDWDAIMPVLTELAALKDDDEIMPRIRAIRGR